MTTAETTYLYRILSYRHVIDLFESRELHFSSPLSWDDPYEKILVHKQSNLFFAQCWCKKAASDAMWRIYSPDKSSLRIRTTRSRLLAAMKAANKNDDYGFVIKDVEYLPVSEIDSRISSIAKELRNSYNSRRAADALLLKRDAFDHEAETRIIVHSNNTKPQTKPEKSYRVAIDPHSLIDNIYFDPRVDDGFMRMCKYYLNERIGYNKTVKKSALYRIKEPVVV